MTQHPQAKLLRMAADNKYQMFICDSMERSYKIEYVLAFPAHNWRPVKQTKTITRWLWAKPDGNITALMYSESEQYHATDNKYPIKLEWSATEFEVEE